MGSHRWVVAVDAVPDEVWAIVFGFLSGSARGVASHVCKRWRAIVGGPHKVSVEYVVQSERLLQWARANGCPWNEETCANAAKGGHLSVLQWAQANGCPWNWRTCEYAAGGGHLSVLQWARANGWSRAQCGDKSER